jgi:cardiolipin synthase
VRGLDAGLAPLRRRLAWWAVVLLVFGGVAAITVVVALFLPFGKGPSLFAPNAPVPPAGSPRFLALVSNVLTLPVETGSRPLVLNNGDAFLRALLADIDGAKSSIDFMVYIWDDGKFSDAALRHLDEKLKAGVQVRVALDAYGAVTAPLRKFEQFRKLGGQTMTFHSLMPLPWAMARDHKRNHRRAIVIDGRIAYTGGIAISDPWLGNARNSNEWRDMMFRVEGPMASHLQGAFAEVWQLGKGELLAGDRFYPPADAEPRDPVKFVPFSSAPSPDLFAMEDFVLLSLEGARRSIVVVSPYFLPDESLRRVLCAKAQAGLDVRILVPNDHNDNRWVRLASQHFYAELLRSGVKIYEYQPTFIHTKLLIVDGAWSVIGSANMDNRSRKLNDEVVLGVADSAFAKQLTDLVDTDLRRAARIDPAQWEKRGFWQRALETIALASVQQY